MRLVPNQDPDDILKRYTAFVKKLTPRGIETRIKVHSKGPACVVGTDNRYIRAATEALHDTFKKETVFIRSGGATPLLRRILDRQRVPPPWVGVLLPPPHPPTPSQQISPPH